MFTRKKLDLVESKAQYFYHIVAFKKEIFNPLLMKKEMDKLIERLGRSGFRHNNRVITKIIDRKPDKKTIVLQIMVPIVDPQNIHLFFDQYEQYFFIPEYFLDESISISIANDMEEFKKAVNQFVQYANLSDVNDIDFKNNHIIEIAKVDVNGNVIGFDLHMEKIKKED